MSLPLIDYIYNWTQHFKLKSSVVTQFAYVVIAQRTSTRHCIFKQSIITGLMSYRGCPVYTQTQFTTTHLERNIYHAVMCYLLLLCLRFLIASFYTADNSSHTFVNILALLIGVIPKLPQLHKFRLFGINKY